MSDVSVEIIVPVWNRPETTRASLAALVAYSPGARFIFVNNGSERETEQLLNEFAEHLDDRALLLSSTHNAGFVKGVNRGLAAAQAAVVGVVRNGVQVGEGWLEPLLAAFSDQPAVGLVIPCLSPKPGRRHAARGTPVFEVDHGSFDAMLINRHVYSQAGGFDEGLDDGLWCLSDYSRRAYQHGFLTVCASQASVQVPMDQLLGSTTRREARLRLSQAAYEERWGRPLTFIFSWSPGETLCEAGEFRRLLLRAARLGHLIRVFVPSGAERLLLPLGSTEHHENMTIEELPRLFSGRALRRRLAQLAGGPDPPILVSEAGGPASEGMFPFVDFRRQIEKEEQRLGLRPATQTADGSLLSQAEEKVHA